MYDDLAKEYFDTEAGYLQAKKLLEEFRDKLDKSSSLQNIEESFGFFMFSCSIFVFLAYSQR